VKALFHTRLVLGNFFVKTADLLLRRTSVRLSHSFCFASNFPQNQAGILLKVWE
jgi:hypothetical protein